MVFSSYSLFLFFPFFLFFSSFFFFFSRIHFPLSACLPAFSLCWLFVLALTSFYWSTNGPQWDTKTKLAHWWSLWQSVVWCNLLQDISGHCCDIVIFFKLISKRGEEWLFFVLFLTFLFLFILSLFYLWWVPNLEWLMWCFLNLGNLPINSLVGTIPNSIGDLSDLEYLYLSFDFIMLFIHLFWNDFILKNWCGCFVCL